MTYPELVILDLDGSLLNSESCISPKDQYTLADLGKAGVIRVIATGRNWWSARNVLQQYKDIDYAIISTGLGIIDYKHSRFLKTHFLTREEVIFLAEFFLNEKVDFMIHNLLPDNHYVLCFDAKTGHPDFFLRRDWYQRFASDLPSDLKKLEAASQFISFYPRNTPRLHVIRKKLPQFKVVRTTSPLTSKYDWLEVFPPDVSKGHALLWLCQRLKINIKNTLCLGNDYNDLDMLEAAGKSYVTDNAPDDLKGNFNVTVSNNDDPLSHIIREY